MCLSACRTYLPVSFEFAHVTILPVHLALQEDHTMGNLIRMQLHSDRFVVFAGYRIPHPLENKMVVKVRTPFNSLLHTWLSGWPSKIIRHSIQQHAKDAVSS
jgi:hypothetical protein